MLNKKAKKLSSSGLPNFPSVLPDLQSCLSIETIECNTFPIRISCRPPQLPLLPRWCCLGLSARFHLALLWLLFFSLPGLDVFWISFPCLFSFPSLFSWRTSLSNFLNSLGEETFTVVFLKMFMFILCLIIGSFGVLYWPDSIQTFRFHYVLSLIVNSFVLISSCSLVLESFPCSSFHFCCCDKISWQKEA